MTCEDELHLIISLTVIKASPTFRNIYDDQTFTLEDEQILLPTILFGITQTLTWEVIEINTRWLHASN